MNIEAGTALVTGASSGIGAAYARQLAARGHDLILSARRQDRLDALAQQLRAAHGCKVEAWPADLANPQDLLRLEEALSTREDIAMLVNCAGLGALGPGATADTDAVDRMVKVNVLALTRLSLAAARAFARRQRGVIVNIGSILALMPVPGASGYSASKAYVLNFSRALQAELEPAGVTVQAVMPGMVRSEFFGGKPAPFPDHLFMEADTLVATALCALDQGERVCFPTLSDPAGWSGLEAARGALVKALTHSGEPAARYGVAPA